MRRYVTWGVGIGCAGIMLVSLVMGQRSVTAAEPAKGQSAKPAAKAAAAPANPPKASVPGAATGKPEAEKVVYTFPDDAKIQEFTKLWQQRQGIVLRMSVLQAYWNEEQAALAELNNKLTADYKVDTAKNYFLDREHRTLVEREAPPAPAGTEAPGKPGPQKGQ